MSLNLEKEQKNKKYFAGGLMHENFKLLLTRQKKKIELGTISGIDQYGYAYNRAKFVACIKNRTIQELCRRTHILY